MTNFKATPFEWNIVATVSKFNPPLRFPATTADLEKHLESDSKLKALATKPLDLIACWNHYGTKIADHNRYQHFIFFTSFVLSLGFSLGDFGQSCKKIHEEDKSFLGFASAEILKNNIHLSPATSLLALKNDLSPHIYTPQFSEQKDKLKITDESIFSATGAYDAVNHLKELERKKRQSYY